MSEKHTVILSKQTLPQLQDLLERQQTLMRNKNLLQQLKDRGESVIQLHDKILKEIQHRKDVISLEETLSNLTLTCNDSINTEFLKEKHVEYVCSKEKPIDDSRYRPHRTLIHKESKLSPNKSSKTTPQDITAASEPKLIHEPTILITLPESLVIENEQAHRIIEEKAKKALSSLANDLLYNEGSGNDVEEDAENQTVIEES
ncbi:hypothetical protein ILUMI_22181 [Ignelater luminosus]|uniref:DNA-directed RNA polymerase II subunit GRINL1A n=1 Tax=Ignelater luminosus TaxID=2038154 RepID=A0A8K0CGA0_IGNLU|nr:hypothetical protein ILUMI_22181 [Ignelater luminosus]